jgi:hypothetical protein
MEGAKEDVEGAKEDVLDRRRLVRLVVVVVSVAIDAVAVAVAVAMFVSKFRWCVSLPVFVSTSGSLYDRTVLLTILLARMDSRS